MACAPPACSRSPTSSPANAGVWTRSGSTRSVWSSAGRRSRRSLGLRDRQALLRPRRRLIAGRDSGPEGGDVAGDLFQARVLGRGEPVAHLRKPLVEPVDGVLDALEPLRDGPQAPSQALDVGRRRDPERAHRRLLGLRGLLARLERALEGAHDQRTAGQLLGDAAQCLLALAGEAVADTLVVVVAHRRQSTGRAAKNCVSQPKVEVQLTRLNARLCVIAVTQGYGNRIAAGRHGFR